MPGLRLGPGWLVGAALSVALTLSRMGAAQEPRRAVLAYQIDAGIEGCFETKELEDAVAARLGYLPFASEAPLSISAQVRRQGAGLSADLKVRDSGGEKQRQLGSATRDCAELSRALALAISVAIDPMSLTRAPAPATPQPQPEPLAPATPPPEPERAPVAPEPVAPKPAPKPAPPAPKRTGRGPELDSTVRVRLLATGHAVFLGLPSTTGGGSLGLGVRRRALWSDAELRYDLPGTAAADGGGSVRASWLGGTIAACHGNRELGLCALGAVARVAAEGEGVSVPRSDSALWAGVGARGSLELPLLGGLFARLHVDGLYRLTPLRLELRQRGVWEAGPLSIVAGLGVGGQL